MIYADNNATTPIHPDVIEVMKPFLESEYGNPNSIHQPGTHTRAAIERSRSQVAKALGVTSSEIVFTGSGSESNNQAISGAMFRHLSEGGNIVTSGIEHSSVTATVKWLAETFGFEARFASFQIKDGAVDPQPFIDLIDHETRLVTVMYANNETGVIMPLKPIFSAAKTAGALTHADSIQAVGKFPVSPKDLCADMISFSAHKFHGPKGAGGLYLRRGVKIVPILHGGGQESGRRAGTENVAYIAGIGKAMELAVNTGMEKAREVRDYFESRLAEENWQGRALVNFAKLERTPNCSNVQFPGQDGNLMVIKLDQQGICASTGSACSSGALSASKGLMAAGLSEMEAAASLRFSFSKFNTKDEVDSLLEALDKIVKPIKKKRRQAAHSH